MPMRFAPARGASVLLSSSSRGPAGAAATIAVGSVAALAAGSTPTVANAGSSSAATFNFGIPRGADAGIKWLYDSTTSMADPGSGDIRFNNATLSSVTAIAVSATGSGADVSDYVATWDDSTSTHKCAIVIREEASNTVAIFNVTAVTDNTNWLELTVVYVSGSLSLTAADPLYVVPLRTGNSGTGTFPGSATDEAVVRFDGAGGATVQNSVVTISDTGVVAGAIFGNAGLKVQDTNASHNLTISPGTNITDHRTLTLTTGDADRTVTISGNATISQDYSATGSPTFASPTVTTLEVGATDTTLSRSAAGVLAVEGTVLLKAGKQTIWIPASAMWPRTTNGPGSASRELTTGGDIMIKGWAFDTTTEEGVQFYIGFPKSWDKSTVTFQAFWTNASGLATETVSWGLSAGAFTNDDAIDTTDLGTEVRVSDTFLAQGDLHVTSESGAVTVGNTPIDDDMVIGQIVRSVSNDDMTGDAELLGVKIFYTTNAATDA